MEAFSLRTASKPDVRWETYDGSVVELPQWRMDARQLDARELDAQQLDARELHARQPDARQLHARAAVNALTRVSRILERSLPELSLADFRVLSAVAEGEGRASRLAHRLALGKPAISSTVDSLVRRGLLTKQAHEADQRATDLALTESGADTRAAAEAALVAVVTQLVDDTEDPEAALVALASLEPAIERRQASIAAARHAAAINRASAAEASRGTQAPRPTAEAAE
jgi:DNA-binding MarR family transcriptional regulator